MRTTTAASAPSFAARGASSARAAEQVVRHSAARTLLAIGRRPCQTRHGSNLFAELREMPALFSWKGPPPLCSHCPQQMFS